MTIHSSWKPVFDNYNFDINKIYEDGNVYPKKEHLFRVFEMDVMDIKRFIKTTSHEKTTIR